MEDDGSSSFFPPLQLSDPNSPRPSRLTGPVHHGINAVQHGEPHRSLQCVIVISPNPRAIATIINDDLPSIGGTIEEEEESE